MLVAVKTTMEKFLYGKQPRRESLLMGVVDQTFEVGAIVLYPIGPEVIAKTLQGLLHDCGQERHHCRIRTGVAQRHYCLAACFAQSFVDVANSQRIPLMNVTAYDNAMHDGMNARAIVVPALGVGVVGKYTAHPR